MRQRLFDRQLWAGLATPIGEFRVGRQEHRRVLQGQLHRQHHPHARLGDQRLRRALRATTATSPTSRRGSAASNFEAYSIAGSAVNDTGPGYQLGLEWAGGPWRFGYAGVYGEPPDNAVVPDKVKYDNVYANWDYGKGKVYLALRALEQQRPYGRLARHPQ